MLSILGILSSLSSWFGLYVAHLATKELVEGWKKNRPPSYEGPDVIGHFVTRRLFTFALPWFLLPVLFVFAWIFVLYFSYAR